jgi:hypothetical protein
MRGSGLGTRGGWYFFFFLREGWVVLGHISFGRGLPRCVGRDSEGSSSARWYGGAVPDPNSAVASSKARPRITSPTRHSSPAAALLYHNYPKPYCCRIVSCCHFKRLSRPTLVGADLSDCSHQYSIIGVALGFT